jgi:arylsulfatase A-like enzyme
MKAISIAHATALCAALITLMPSSADAAEKKPNIVFVFSDDVSRNTWGAYGSRDCKTPHIDRIARDGMRFDRAYCAVAMCAPFRQELYSGRSPWRTGTLYDLDNDPYELENVIDRPQYKTIAAEMKRQLHAKLAELGDEDPIKTEQGLMKGGGNKGGRRKKGGRNKK